MEGKSIIPVGTGSFHSRSGHDISSPADAGKAPDSRDTAAQAHALMGLSGMATGTVTPSRAENRPSNRNNKGSGRTRVLFVL
ncbi:hypothetical protein SKAU_G00106090 [Synaphobranchus kaupii]|uniref:Uncharacterized protein n=1 Tax=Synaphobranchus kaupii TaxID=118154 RepID=A0A9Q1G0I5_SYNKA|nr:hypothetical protein SKAU_G00106090 [Synaphobranchus kaupii]